MRLFEEILNTLDIIAPLIAIFFFLRRPYKITRELKIVFAFCVVQLLCNLTATFLDYFMITNYWVYKINTVASFLVILLLFSKYLISIKKKITIIIAFIFVLISTALLIKGDGISSYNSINAALASLIVVGLCLYFFYDKLINTSAEVSIPSTSVFWCVVGIFTYYAGAFFIFISYKYLIETDSATIATLWRFHNILLLICFLYISYGVICKEYQTI